MGGSLNTFKVKPRFSFQLFPLSFPFLSSTPIHGSAYYSTIPISWPYGYLSTSIQHDLSSKLDT